MTSFDGGEQELIPDDESEETAGVKQEIEVELDNLPQTGIRSMTAHKFEPDNDLPISYEEGLFHSEFGRGERI